MHREMTGEGLVFKVGRFRENDCWVRFFSPALGMVTAFAFGGAKSRRRFCGCLDSLNRVLFTIRHFPVKGYYCLEEGTLLQGFARLRRDLGRQGLAANCMHFVQALHVDAQTAPTMHSLLVESLQVLEQAETVPPVFVQLFRAKICFDQGFAPSFGVCASCGRDVADEETTLVLDKGRFYCRRCAAASGPGLRLSGQTQAVLRRVAGAGPRIWGEMHPSRRIRAELFEVIEGYVQCHLGLRWIQGRFVSA